MPGIVQSGHPVTDDASTEYRFSHFHKEVHMRKKMFLVSMILVASLMACGGDGGTAGGGGAGDTAAGQTVYSQVASPACNTCHSLEPDVTMVGPSLANMGSVAGSRVSGMSAEEYLRQAIVEPDAHIVEGFSPGIMPGTYGTQLSEQQINDLVAYLSGL
jgi:cytochrome c2